MLRFYEVKMVKQIFRVSAVVIIVKYLFSGHLLYLVRIVDRRVVGAPFAVQDCGEVCICFTLK